MPELKDFRKTVEVELPGYPGSKVVIFEGVLVKDVGDVPIIDESSKFGDTLRILPKVIKEWNFHGADGKPLPVNADTLGLLTVEAINVLVKHVGITNEEKKS